MARIPSKTHRSVDDDPACLVTGLTYRRNVKRAGTGCQDLPRTAQARVWWLLAFRASAQWDFTFGVTALWSPRLWFRTRIRVIIPVEV